MINSDVKILSDSLGLCLLFYLCRGEGRCETLDLELVLNSLVLQDHMGFQCWGNIKEKKYFAFFSQAGFFSVKTCKNDETFRSSFKLYFECYSNRFEGLAGCYILKYSRLL